MIDLLDDMIAHADVISIASDRANEGVETHDCDGCGEYKPDVDLYAENIETGEELWLCLTCGDW